MNIQKQFGCQVLTHVGETATVENSNFDVDDFWILMLNAWVMIDRFECLLNNLEHKTWFVFFLELTWLSGGFNFSRCFILYPKIKWRGIDLESLQNEGFVYYI